MAAKRRAESHVSKPKKCDYKKFILTGDDLCRLENMGQLHFLNEVRNGWLYIVLSCLAILGNLLMLVQRL